MAKTLVITTTKMESFISVKSSLKFCKSKMLNTILVSPIPISSSKYFCSCKYSPGFNFDTVRPLHHLYTEKEKETIQFCKLLHLILTWQQIFFWTYLLKMNLTIFFFFFNICKWAILFFFYANTNLSILLSFPLPHFHTQIPMSLYGVPMMIKKCNVQ